LVDNGALDNYIKNFNKVDNGWRIDNWDGFKLGMDYTIKDFLDNNKMIYYIYGSFIWEETSEGYKFWNELSNEWVSSLRK
jgi:hypothetical protein